MPKVGEKVGELLLEDHWGENWDCLCSCGRPITLTEAQVSSGDFLHCGQSIHGPPSVAPKPAHRGETYGRLEVLRRGHAGCWVCRCADCGFDVTVRYPRRGVHPRCPARPTTPLGRPVGSGRADEHFKERRFGKLRVEAPLRGTGRWTCRCDCGRSIEASATKLRSGKLRTCGCEVSPLRPAGRGQRRGEIILLAPLPLRERADWVARCCSCLTMLQATTDEALMGHAPKHACALTRAASPTRALGAAADVDRDRAAP